MWAGVGVNEREEGEKGEEDGSGEREKHIIHRDVSVEQYPFVCVIPGNTSQQHIPTKIKDEDESKDKNNENDLYLPQRVRPKGWVGGCLCLVCLQSKKQREETRR